MFNRSKDLLQSYGEAGYAPAHGRISSVLFLGNPIGIVQGLHCSFRRLFAQFTTGKQAGYFTDKLFNVLCRFRSALFVRFYCIRTAAA